MKKITISVNGANTDNQDAINSAMNDLSGVVAAEVVQNEKRAYAYAGDKMPREAILDSVRHMGVSATVTNEEFFTDFDDFRQDQNMQVGQMI